MIGGGVLPNNDAQSLVFDVSNVFAWDKFSGYDRVETGTRANYGARYFAAFDNGASMDAAIGQSVNLAGANPFDPDPVSNVGAGSGLDSTFSDYVAGVSVDTGLGPRFSARGRFDETTFALNRAELQATAAVGAITTSANYIYSVGEPNNDLAPATSAIRAAASVNFAENWRAFGSITYDVAKAAVAGDSFGIAFDNECLTISIAYSEIREGYTDLEASRWINFRLQMRTLGETSYSSNLSRTSF
jgi:LPS-assembly protein